MSTAASTSASSIGTSGLAEAADAALVAQRLGDGAAEHDADILGGMMEVDVQVALGAHVRSNSPWRARAVSMWSRKPIPVAISARPDPSRSSVRRDVGLVSEVERVRRAVRGMGAA